MKSSFVLACLALLLNGCATGCAICYEDEWSREPFPGQPKQHIPTVIPDHIPE